MCGVEYCWQNIACGCPNSPPEPDLDRSISPRSTWIMPPCRSRFERRLAACFAALHWLVTLSAAIADPSTPPALRDARYSVHHWDVDEGLPGERVFALAQTPDGYIWIGTDAGLARYDGVRFRTFVLSGIPGNSQVQSLFCDSRGRLWIARSGHSLILYEGGRFRPMTLKDGMPGSIDAMAEDPEGTI